MSGIDDAVAWLAQARSDARTAEAIAEGKRPMRPEDIGCHVALLCAQSFEKSIKGSMLLVGQTLTLTHEVETRIDSMLRQADIRKGPWKLLRPLFDAPGVRRLVLALLAWTPGAASAADPNYEYPWRKHPTAVLEVPFGHPLFEDTDAQARWIEAAQTLSDGLAKIGEAIERGR